MIPSPSQSFGRQFASFAASSPFADFEVRCEVLASGRPVAVVVAGGELDLATADAFGQVLQHAARTQPVVLVDLTGVTFMDCSALRSLTLVRRDLKPRGGGLCLVTCRPNVLRLFALTQLGFAIAPNGERGRAMLDASYEASSERKADR